jgi:ubiquitin-protein ligase
VAALKPLCFNAIALVELIQSHAAAHAFAKSALSTSAGGGASVVGSAKKRLMRLASEVSSLQSSLPVEFGSSLFARADETRLDILKVLIVGPAGSPYENGCFEFDVWLPPSYPEQPPKVQLMTTGQGQVRFNPNLYNCGKVCLSLLGTWQGPGWDPVRSTLLQVLISIQSLIMVDEPFFNEPSFQTRLGTPQGNAASSSYNATVREATLRHAIAAQLERPSPVFKTVIDKHFKLKGGSLHLIWCSCPRSPLLSFALFFWPATSRLLLGILDTPLRFDHISS